MFDFGSEFCCIISISKPANQLDSIRVLFPYDTETDLGHEKLTHVGDCCEEQYCYHDMNVVRDFKIFISILVSTEGSLIEINSY
jgi:hypothetical protein